MSALRNRGVSESNSRIGKMPATSSCSKLVVWSRFAHPSRPFAAGKPVGIHMGTLDTTTFQVTSDAARLSFGQVSCSRPSIVFGRSGLSGRDVRVAVLPCVPRKRAPRARRSERYRRFGVFAETSIGV